MTEGSTGLNEAEMSELEKLQLRINEKSDETLESTRRMRELCAEAKVSFLLMTTRSLMTPWRAQERCGSCALRPR
jgi:DNA-directed RNA polymerase subunit M/transcription elongation factor TFIIS